MAAGKPDIGLQIRRRRGALGLSLRKLAEMTDVTAGFLGQVERGESSPSIATLLRIADALETPVHHLLFDEYAQESGPLPAPDIVMDAVSERRLSSQVVQIELLSRDFRRKMEFFRARMRPGVSTGVAPLAVPTEQIVYVLSGALKVTLANGEHILQHDHFLHFNGDELRGLETASNEEALWISVITPPVS